MVPIPESSYFPPLDKCLAGEQLLISWKAVYLTISDIDDLSYEKQPILEQYLNQDDVLAVLAQPFTAFTKPSPQTKAAFETKTSAINVTPSSNGPYDIKQIKEDTLWLSKEAGIDEVSALRVVIVECQSRPYAQLLGRFSDEEVVSIQDAAGSSRILSLVPVALLSDSADSKVIQADFDTQDSRRVRTLQTYLSERQYLLKCVESLLHSALYWPQVGGKEKAPEVSTPLLERIGEVLMAKMGEPVGMVLQGISAIERNIKNLEQGSGWYKEEGVRDDIELDWLRTQLVEVLHTMKIVFQLVDCLEEITSSAVVVAWFRLASTYSFFTGFQVPEPYLQQLVHTLQLSACLISLSTLSLGDCVDYLSDPGNDMALLPTDDIAYILNPQAIIEVHNSLMEAAEATYVTAGPAIFAWCSILAAMRGRKAGQEVEQAQYEDGSSSGDGQLIQRPDVYDEVMEQIMDSIDSDPIHHLAQKAADGCHFLETISEFSVYLGDTPRAVFLPVLGARMRIVLMDLISSARANLEYIPEVLTAAISCLTGGQDYWHLTEAKQLQPQNNPIASFLANDQLVGAFLVVAASRYPYESLPFLKLVKAVAACTSSYMQNNTRSIIDFLDTIPTFTYVLPEGFANYETTHEEDNNNNIRLTTTVQLFESRMISSKMVLGRGSLNRSLVPAGDFCIPAGTFGRIVSESGPRVAIWFHEYSALKYFGKLLETFLNSRDQIDATTGERVDRDCVAEIIGLLATLVLSSSKTVGVTAHSRDEAQRVLESASAGLSRNSDIISVIFSIFEEELQIQTAAIGSEVPLELLLGCTQFIHAVVPISPGRVWPLIDRSGLLDNGRGIGSGSGRLSSIVRNVELVTSRYKFLISCTRLFDSLVEDFVTHAIARKCTNKSAARFGAREELGTGVPEQVLTKVLLSFTQFLVEVFEDSCTWNFAVDEERTSLSKNISRTLNHIVSYTYGVDGSSDPKSGIMAGLKPAAGYIVDTFLSTNSGTLRFQPLLSGYLDGISTWQTTINLPFMRLREKQVRAIMSFTGSLLQISALEARSASHLEMQLFKASPLIARLYAVNVSYRNSVVTVFEALIVSASSNSDEPPSLLGHLGPHTSKNFLRSLTDLDSPLPHDDTVINIWHFFSMVVSCRQQWFANYLLTGKAPRDALKRRCESDELPPSRSLLSNTLENLSSLPQLSKKKALAMLEFVSLAQNYWPWTLYSQEKHALFIDAISEYLGTLPPIQKQPADTLEDRIDACYKTQIVSHVAKILAMHLFHARQRGDSKAVDKLVPNLSYLSRFAVAVPDYNTSLHTNLKRNFESRYPGCQLREFQKTRLDDRNLGRDYFYDLSLADKMLRFDGAWTGRKDDGYSLELATANVNLSLVDTQIAVLESWKVLAIELSSDLKEKVELQKIIAKVARDCIASNILSSFSEPVFIKLNQTRAEFSLILLQRLVEVKSEVHELYGENGNFRHGILSTAWEAIRSLQGSFGMALAAGDATYYRCLLRLLFLVLRIHAESKFPDPDPKRSTNKLSQQQTTEVIPLVLEILEHVVAKGLRDLVATLHDAVALHDQPTEFPPQDIALITGILQTCLRIPGIEFYHLQIVTTMKSPTCETARVAANLFSWSTDLAINGDPVYGELSILFLLELSSMPAMAEQLAIDGILGHLGSAKITAALRSGKVNPFVDSAGIQRCYSIWVRGILPLLLNLLDAVGASIATEISLFLNQFPALLNASSSAFDAPETSRIVSKSQPKYMTLSVCSEVHSLSLIIFILNTFRDAQPDIPEVPWDSSAVAENVEFWLGSRAVLRERILPMGKRDIDLARQKPENLTNGAVNRLEEAVLAELKGIKDVLSSAEE